MTESTVCSMCGRSFVQRGRGRRAYCKQCTAKADREVGRTVRAQCRECGKAFAAARTSARYCSDECRIKGRRSRVREGLRRYMADPEKRAIMLARRRAWDASRRAVKEREGRGKEGRGKEQQRLRQRRTPGSVAAPKSSECRLCGRTFKQYGRSARHAYCKLCAAKAEREITRVIHTKCKECGKAFSTKRRTVRYCSTECSAEARRRSLRECAHRRMADPKKRAAATAAVRVWFADRRDKKGEGRRGRTGGPPQPPAAA